VAAPDPAVREQGSATVPVASSGVPPDESVREATFGEDAERSGRDARALQFQNHLHPPAHLASCSITWKKAKG